MRGKYFGKLFERNLHIVVTWFNGRVDGWHHAPSKVISIGGLLWVVMWGFVGAVGGKA